MLNVIPFISVLSLVSSAILILWYIFRPFNLAWMVKGFKNERCMPLGYLHLYKYGFIYKTIWRLFFVLACGFIGFSLYFGLQKIFYWLPSDWGSVGENGYITPQENIAGFVSFVLTMFFVLLFCRGLFDRIELLRLRTEAASYEYILQANAAELIVFAARCRKKSKEAESFSGNFFTEAENSTHDSYLYGQIAHYAEQQYKKIADKSV